MFAVFRLHGTLVCKPNMYKDAVSCVIKITITFSGQLETNSKQIIVL